ncbi:hypothetical protein RN001_013330 [Aquatica leii]|uniref:Uncharacterized protein n=1 Tax=Aquatica leii TaxID=1421715 RepID=A0AAN7NW99_9COLE|nr:hypothetical protein RN001_013330 [Aquatica leii]
MSNNFYKPDNNDRKNLRYYFAQYCSATSIHGTQYLGERGRSLIERLFWILVITAVSTLCVILIVKTYKKWVTSPVIVTFATTETPISNIPFPSITICPEVKTDPDIFNYTDVYVKRMMKKKLHYFEKQMEQSISLVCQENDLPFGDFSGYNDFIEDDGVYLLITSAPELDPIGISAVSWKGDKKKPDDYLDFLFTREGVCYNFNMLNVEDILRDPEEYSQNVSKKVNKIRGWSLDGGYPKISVNDSYPRRTVFTGLDGGFSFNAMFVNGSHLDYVCGDSLQGFKVVLHHPADWPNLDKHFRVPLDEAVHVGIKPRLTTISDELKSYSPENRKCYLSDEKRLLYFKVYTQNNCMEECFANYTLKKCDCQAFYMPKFHDGPICGPGKRKCIEESKINYIEVDGDKCACLPSCTYLEYDLELTQTNWNWHAAFDVLRKTGLSSTIEIDNIHLSRLAVYFKDMQFLSAERHELYGIVDFLSNVGGLLGLFIGFSFTSCIEIIYFCTLRLWCNYKKYGRRYWSGEPELVDGKEE